MKTDSERGQVANFPKEAHVTLPIDPKLDFGTDDFTVSFWIKVDNTTIPGSDPSIIANKDWDSGGNTGFVVSLNNADQPGEDLWKVNASDHSGHRLDWSASKNGATTLVDGQWHHVLVSFDRDATMDVYFDGALKQTVADADSKDMTTIPGDLAPDDLPFTIMQDATGHYGQDFAAMIDDVRIWTGKALSDDEVTAVYAFKPETGGGGNDLSYGADVYLPLDADLKDATSHHIDATDKGTAVVTFVDDDARGKVASFEAAAYAQFPMAPELDFGTGDFSFAFWIKINKSISVSADPSIFQ
ncbi:MAG: LamG domain-containing protein [Bacteroidota bacterium]